MVAAFEFHDKQSTRLTSDLTVYRDMQNLIDAIRHYVTLDEHDVESIRDLFAIKVLKKNDSFLQPGMVCDHFAFVEQGLLRHAIYNAEGEEKTIYFSAEHEFVCDFESFYSKTASQKSITALEDTILACISHSKMQVFYNKVSTGERFGRLYLEETFSKVIHHIVSMHTDSAEQVYLNFLSAYKHISHRIPQYYIASFVGVTPQSLSRIRRKIVKK